MDASQAQDWMYYVRPNPGSSQTFEDISLSPRHNQNQSSNTSGGFSHTPLEHEIVASESVWNDSGVSDELIEQHIAISTTLPGQRFSAAPASSSRECSMNARNPGPDEAIPRSIVFEPCSDLTDLSTPGTGSDVALVETLTAVDTASGPPDAVSKLSLSADFPIDKNAGSPISESDISDEFSNSSDHVNNSSQPAELAITIPPARWVTHAPFPRVERPEPPTSSSIPGFFEIPIPIFPFPAGTSRCKTHNCPIKIRHEQGPYLHEGKLRTREGSIFGSSNPPPEIWFLYDMPGKERFQADGDKALAPVELFVKYHFGETRGERVF